MKLLKIPHFCLLSLLVFLTSCGTINKVALNITSDLVGSGAKEMETETSWDMFNQAMPGNIKFLEALAYQDPENESLLKSLTKAYGGLGFGVYDTLWLEEMLSEREDERVREKAIMSYSRSMDYGVRYLNEQGIKYNDLIQNVNNRDKISKLLNDNLSDDDLETVFYLAQSWAGLINLQKSSPIMIAQLPVAKYLFDWVCQKRPNLYYGSCDIFYGAYEVSRPAMLGGDLNKGKNYFQKAINDYPNNLLAKVSYVMFYVVPVIDEAEYEKMKSLIKEQINKIQQEYSWKATSGELKKDPIALFNAIAIKRFEIIESNEKEIF